MRTFFMVDDESGEEFFAEADTKAEAMETAKQYFESPRCYGEVNEEFAECMGLDTY